MLVGLISVVQNFSHIIQEVSSGISKNPRIPGLDLNPDPGIFEKKPGIFRDFGIAQKIDDVYKDFYLSSYS